MYIVEEKHVGLREKRVVVFEIPLFEAGCILLTTESEAVEFNRSEIVQIIIWASVVEALELLSYRRLLSPYCKIVLLW